MTESEILRFNQQLEISFAEHLSWLMQRLNAGLAQVKAAKVHQINTDPQRVARESLYILLGGVRVDIAAALPEVSAATHNSSPRSAIAVRLNEFAASIPAPDEKSG